VTGTFGHGCSAAPARPAPGQASGLEHGEPRIGATCLLERGLRGDFDARIDHVGWISLSWA
jgi:hypothetical protein